MMSRYSADALALAERYVHCTSPPHAHRALLGNGRYVPAVRAVGLCAQKVLREEGRGSGDKKKLRAEASGITYITQGGIKGVFCKVQKNFLESTIPNYCELHRLFVLR